MKYITPDVPNITITDYNGIRNMIDFVYGTEIINLSTGSIIMFELPILDSDIQFNMDEYNIRLSWNMVNLDGVHIENKADVYSGMKLIRKTISITNESTPAYKFIFYNGEDNISDIVNRFIGESNDKNNTMKIRIKYFDGATKLKKITKGNWLDVYSREDIFVPVGEQKLIPLGFALELPQGWEGHLAPRSSTFKKWGIIQTNHVGVVDDTYIGDNDEWMMPVYCVDGKEYEFTESEMVTKFDKEFFGNITVKKDDYNNEIYTGHKRDEELCYVTSSMLNKKGTWIHKGDKIGQFRIMETMPELEFEEVESLGNSDRSGFGSTGSK